MADFDINKYTEKPGVYIVDSDNSVITPPPVQEGIVNFVLGFSKKGKFNAPILLTGPADVDAYYGPIDRSLEKKGSFFHRTLKEALASGPVWGLSLLTTNDTDTLDYVSLSLAPQIDNGAVLTSEYDNFFNKSGFWKRDTDNFISLANQTNKIFHITNMSDKKISVFIFKSDITGYDVTAEAWYGSVDKIPTWMNKTDLISDYLVRVVVVSGDWSNYITLSNDLKWGVFFNGTGLRKSKINDFINDKAVNVLQDETASLIPYFKNINKSNIFIESIINNKTDKTGLFCAFDVDKLETDLPNGLIDLTGSTLLYLKNRLISPTVKEEISFLSYSDSIIDTTLFETVALDRAGNVNGFGTISTKTTAYANGDVSGLTVNNTAINALTTAAATVTFTASSGYAVIGNTKLTLTTTSLNIAAITRSATTGESNYKVTVFYIDSTGTINALEGAIISAASGNILAYTVAGLVLPSSYPSNAIVLGYVLSEGPEGAGAFNQTYTAVAVDGSGFVSLAAGGVDYTINSSPADEVNITFTATANVVKSSYAAYRRKQIFDYIVAGKDLTKGIIIDTSGVKRSLSTALWVDNSTNTTVDKNLSIKITGSTIGTAASTGVIIYTSDDEFYMDANGLMTTTGVPTAGYGIAAKYSKVFEKYYEGAIKTGDYFFVKIADVSVKFMSNLTDGFDYLVIPTASVNVLYETGFKFWIQGHSVNDGVYTSLTDGATSVTGLTLVSETAYKLTENATETLTGETVRVYNYDNKAYLQMYIISGNLTVKFYNDLAFTSPKTLSGGQITANANIYIYSGEGSYEQSLEVETPVGYTITDNKILIDGTRYPEVKIGDFLAAYVDFDLLSAGEVPKMFTRILTKKPWTGNTINSVNYYELTTDAKIDVKLYGTSDYQTTRYTFIEDYIDTYKAIALSPFIVRASSLPDGTDETLTALLAPIQQSTALYNAITNKNTFAWRYLIDSFGLGLTSASKQELADICGARRNCIGFLNMPSIKQFKASSSPSFVNSSNELITAYVKTGGNLEANPAFLYSFAQGEGQSCVGYFTPYITIDDNGRPLEMPPAAFVANAYMRKNISRVAGIYPYTIAIGFPNGRIFGAGSLEYNFNDEEIKDLNAMGANPIAYIKDKGYKLETENTAQTDIKSSLSFLHSREVLIELENALYDMLLPFQGKFNTPGIRAQIKRLADNICQRFKERSALYDFINVCDESNNTTEIIDNQLGVLTTKVEIVKGMLSIVNFIEVVSTGQLASTGFTG